MGLFDDFPVTRAEDNVLQGHSTSVAWSGSFGVFTGSHGKEETPNEKVRGMGVDCVMGRALLAMNKSMHGSQEEGSDGLLPVGRRVEVLKCHEKSFQGGEQLGASRDVQGAWLEMVPKRRSQMACGIFDSSSHHWLRALAKMLSLLAPACRSVEGKKGSENKLSFLGG